MATSGNENPPQNSFTTDQSCQAPDTEAPKGDRGYQPTTGEHPWNDRELLNKLNNENF